jgi:hypothetical protein
MKFRQKRYEDDDGRVITNMNVEGMRWYDKNLRQGKASTFNQPQGGQMTRSEARQYTWYSMLAALAIVATFSLTWVLFVLFCTEIWFR